jgi:hypothetical protein
MGRIIFISGASSGFGKAIAEKFAESGDNVIITGRRKDRLEKLKKDIESRTQSKALVLAFDIQNRKSVFEAVASLPPEWRDIDVLVNNAGLAAGRDHFHDADMEDWEKMIDTNIKGLLYLSKAVAPIMLARKSGHIINIGSTAAKEVYEKGNVYCATKSAVDSISQSMRIDMLQHGIKVSTVHPGAAETEFSMVRLKGDQAKAKAVYEGFKPLSAEDVAQVVYFCTTLPSHVCINDLVITATAQANSFYFHRI